MRQRVIAVGVVLLLPAALARRAVAASQALPGGPRLGPRALPHVTLAMAAVRRDALPLVAAALLAVGSRHRAPLVTLQRAAAIPGPRGPRAWYEVRRSRGLASLHRGALEALAPHRLARVTRAAFHGRRASASSRRWVAGFEEHALDRYRPHVTLGHGVPAPDPALPLGFRAARLALCQLGDRCTCAKLLWTGQLAAR